MSVINTNITALISQQNLTNSKSALTTSMERLSSGLRINSAADDAAGQAIANRMSAQITGLSTAQRNANDGISVAQTTEGALNQINDNLQRVRELTVQAQNGTNSDSDLESIQNEIGQRLNEINRISEETSFNGVKVLASDQELSIQVGANDGETINISLKEINSDELGLQGFDVTGGFAKSVQAGGFEDAGGDVAASDATFNFTDSSASSTVTVDGVFKGSDDSYYVRDTEGNYYDTATVDVASAGSSTVDVTFDGTSTPKTEAEMQAAGLGSLDRLDSALNEVDALRSDLGAIQNRFDSAINNLATTETNLSAARSRIEDADYAVEVSNMTRAQILQQAGTSVLAQANQVPQGVLSLLG
ncbi:FliC/FljB family flagellin [Modicisalibacter luteus]|uniref:Flagellin n=1 Tax=Modicisalibacter luteus TaxID=453962 RepID=A0ABV7M2L5_9GAMM|nr:FliC/FljB family flagellin [Halomonas lutea]GHA84444.1 flagellin [Halomonas lutea]